MQCMDYFQKNLSKILTMIMIVTRKEFMPTEVERNSKTSTFYNPIIMLTKQEME